MFLRINFYKIRASQKLNNTNINMITVYIFHRFVFFLRSGPVNGDECYFWRTTGCVFGSKCRFRHVTKNKGIDMSSVTHKVGKNSDGKKPQRFNY